ncbi:MAG: ferrous iron transport protein A [Chloroflexi bacterium]|nr:ferrous iron transport protein A [Chloroflexota bacterium]
MFHSRRRFSENSVSSNGHNRVQSLTEIPRGRKVKLVEINAGCRAARRLAEMGLTPGVELEILQDSGGPLLLSVRGARLAIGRGIAGKLLVHANGREPS